MQCVRYTWAGANRNEVHVSSSSLAQQHHHDGRVVAAAQLPGAREEGIRRGLRLGRRLGPAPRRRRSSSFRLLELPPALLFVLLHRLGRELDGLVVGHHVPQAVGREHDEAVGGAEGARVHVRRAADGGTAGGGGAPGGGVRWSVGSVG